MRDIAKGLTVDMESALREEPPGAATFTM
jgi:hypothetical protein